MKESKALAKGGCRYHINTDSSLEFLKRFFSAVQIPAVRGLPLEFLRTSSLILLTYPISLFEKMRGLVIRQEKFGEPLKMHLIQCL